MSTHPSRISLSDETESWLTANVAGYRSPGTLTKFAFGQSNPTFKLSAASGHYVLRSKPLGRLLPKAHAIEREFRVLRALENSDVPTPRVYALCEDASLLGAPFFVMECVEGRIFYDQRLPGFSPEERMALFDGMNRAVSQLHLIDPLANDLADYGRPEGFMHRQVELWTRQYRATETDLLPGMESLIEWLPAHIPAGRPNTVFHGDLRLDNMIFHPTEPRVIALLDWELSTIGDPWADLAYHMMVWRVGADVFRGFGDLDLATMGIPSEAQYLRWYYERTGFLPPPDWNFYLAFSLFRVAAILQGVRRRGIDGNASAADALDVGARARPLSDLGWAIASTA